VVDAIMQQQEAFTRLGMAVALLPLGTANDVAAAAGISVVSAGVRGMQQYTSVAVCSH
jgi:diacylglycerol kinase family enzyme